MEAVPKGGSFFYFIKLLFFTFPARLNFSLPAYTTGRS